MDPTITVALISLVGLIVSGLIGAVSVAMKRNGKAAATPLNDGSAVLATEFQRAVRENRELLLEIKWQGEALTRAMQNQGEALTQVARELQNRQTRGA